MKTLLLSILIVGVAAGNLDPIQIPLDFQGGYTLATINVGTPPVEYRVGLTINGIIGGQLDSFLANSESKKPYETSQSSSSNLTKYKCNVELDFNEQQSGNVVVDKLTLNGVTVPNYVFCNTNAALVYFYNFSKIQGVDGTWSLGRERDGFITSVLPLLQNFKIPQFTLHYNQKAKYFDTLQKKAGLLTLGGLDKANCGEFKYFNGNDEAFWSVKADAVTFNKRTYYLTKDTEGRARFYTFSFESDNLCLPDDVVKTIRDYFYLDDSYKVDVDCVKAKNAPNIVIRLNGGTEFNLTSSDYVEELTPGKCQLRVQKTTAFGDQSYAYPAAISFGIPFLRAHCVNFDIQRNKIGIAKVLNK